MKETLYKAAIEAGKIIKEYFETKFIVESKDVISNLVTEVDKKSEARIIEVIRTEFPDHNILSEEIGALNTDSDIKWIIDPIDGTINYAHSIPICCVSIGVEKKGQVILGLVYNPMSGEVFLLKKEKVHILMIRKFRFQKKIISVSHCLLQVFLMIQVIIVISL